MIVWSFLDLLLATIRAPPSFSLCQGDGILGTGLLLAFQDLSFGLGGNLFNRVTSHGSFLPDICFEAQIGGLDI